MTMAVFLDRALGGCWLTKLLPTPSALQSLINRPGRESQWTEFEERVARVRLTHDG
jgi:hypothetical protein